MRLCSDHSPSTRARAAVEALLVAPMLALALPHAVHAGDEIFNDGFELCEASNWSSATGLPDCFVDLVCATPSAGKACVAGRLFDVEASSRLCSSPLIATGCTGSELGGSCALALRLYDAVSFISNPSGATPLAADETLVDGCGRFRISGVTVPSSGFGAVTVDDAADAGDSIVLAADARPVASGSKAEHLRIYAVRRATDEAWTTTAGSPFAANTFGDTGSFVAIFLHAGLPVSGVEIRSNGSAVTDDDYYFSDSSALQRSVVDASATSSGANGTALLVTTSLSTLTGAGSEPAACVWPSVTGASAAGVVVVHEFKAEISGQPGTECP